VHPEPSINDDEFNTGNDFFSAQDDGHDGNNLCVTSISTVARSTTAYNQDNHTQQLDMDDNAELLATIETSDTAIVTNSPQSRAITSVSATQLNPEILAFINRQIEDGVRQYEDRITNMKRSLENLENKYNTSLMKKKRRSTTPDSLPTISTASECQNRFVHFSTGDEGFIINAGLKNVGNSCYLNAYLQVVASLTFLPDCLSRPPTLSSEKFPLYSSFATVISSMVMNRQQKPIVNPEHFIETFMSACDNFDHSFESFEQRKFHDIINFNRNYGQLLTLEHILNNC
jgi:hypothetical protein